MKCLVTGAAGFVGSELVRELLKQGYSVRALLRPGGNDANLKGISVEIMYGDVRDVTAIAQAMQGIDYVFHTASLYTGTHWYNFFPKEIYNINVEGTRVLCQTALDAGVKKFIYTGSTGSIGCIKNKPTGENMAFNMLGTRSHYEKSKSLGEQTALAFHKKGLSVVSVNPSFLVGPRDSRPSPTGEIIIKFLNRRYPCYFHAPLSLSEMKGTVQAHINALTSGRSGERYIVTSDHYLTVLEFFQILERISGVKKPFFPLPIFMLKIFAIANEALIGLIRIFGIGKSWRPLISYDLTRYFSQGCLYDPIKAKKELGFMPSPVETAIRESVDWYVKNGYIKKSSCEIYFTHNNLSH
ncbi:MAG TPA: NAD-dependent epimerase/dehydratase family protein [Candidatus Paceibacterota bacterium]